MPRPTIRMRRAIPFHKNPSRNNHRATSASIRDWWSQEWRQRGFLATRLETITDTTIPTMARAATGLPIMGVDITHLTATNAQTHRVDARSSGGNGGMWHFQMPYKRQDLVVRMADFPGLEDF